RRRLGAGRAAPGGRRAGPRRRPGVLAVRCPGAVRAPGQGPQRVLRTGHGQPAELRRDRCWRIPRGGLRTGERRVSEGFVRYGHFRTRVEAEKLPWTRGGDEDARAAYDEPHG